MKLTGKVVNDKGQPQPFLKVYVSDSAYKITPKKFGAITDDNGNYSIDVPEKITQEGLKTFDVDGDFLTVSETGRPLAKRKLYKENNVYDFDTSILMDAGLIQEVTITADRKVEKQQATKSTPKKKYWWIIPTVIGVLLIGGGVYYAVKLKTNK
jgi:hypothetical protein